MDALIGCTGFVGGCLREQHGFDELVNRTNIDAMAGRRFDTVVCAAAPGSMLEANRFSERDKTLVERLIEQLDRIEADRFVLISTIAVLEGFRADGESRAVFETATPYGVNRRVLEEWAGRRSGRSLIVRLPALVGRGLRKNFLFDIVNPVPSMLPPERFEVLATALSGHASLLRDLYAHDAALGMYVLNRAMLDRSGARQVLDAAVTEAGFSAVRFTNPESRFQFYDMRRLWGDIAIADSAGLDVVHLAPPPLAARDVFVAVAGTTMPATGARVHSEDMRTDHAGLWERSGPYICEADEVLEALRGFGVQRNVVA